MGKKFKNTSNNKIIKDKINTSTNQEEVEKKDSLNRTSKFNRGRYSGRPSKSKNKVFDKGIKSGTFNDVEWYDVSNDITGPAANVPFNVFNGVDYHVWSDSKATPTDAPRSFIVPGVLVYKYIPWYGNSDITSALNVAMRGLFAYLRKANSGRTNYEAPDLMQYIMAMDGIYTRIHEIKRLLKLVSYYNSKNRTIPLHIFMGLNIDINDAVSNYNDYRGKLNIAISMINSLAVPKTFSLFSRRAVLASSVLSDEEGRPTQLIVPQTDGYWRYDPTGKKGGRFNFIPFHKYDNAGWQNENVAPGRDAMIFEITKISQLLEELTLDINALLANQDINIMAGDIMKAYDNDVYTLPYLQENESLEFLYDENLLQQFRNSTVLDIPCASYAQYYSDMKKPTYEEHWDEKFRNAGFIWFKTEDGLSPIPTITQSNNALVCKLYHGLKTNRVQFYTNGTRSSASMIALDKIILDVDVTPKPELVVEWSRLMMLPSEFGESIDGVWAHEIYVGTEIGLGYLYVVGKNDYVPIDNQASDVLTNYVVAQWYQRGLVNQFRYNTRTQPNANQLILYGGTRTQSSVDNSDNKEVFNNIVIHNAVTGMRFAPRSYPAYQTLFGDDQWNRLVYVRTTTPGMQFSTYTTLISKDTLRGLHSVAILGLLAKSFTRS